mgnify:FL=1
MKKEKIHLEYLLNATSKNILWGAISTPTGLEDWFADKVVSTVPNGEIYSYVESSMMRFFIINFYAQNRVIDFEKEMPKNGYLLVGERDFNYIKEKYGEQYTFEQTLRSDRKGNDVKDYILLFNFQQNTAE